MPVVRDPLLLVLYRSVARFLERHTSLPARLRERRIQKLAQRNQLSIAQARTFEKRLTTGLEVPRRGHLHWFHAASLGESLSVLGVVEQLLNQAAVDHILITVMSSSSPVVLSRRVEEIVSRSPATEASVDVRFAPFDFPDAVESFAEAWKPDSASFVESELWPNLLTIPSRRRSMRLSLLNATLSERSRFWWTRWPLKRLFQHNIRCFERVHCQKPGDVNFFRLQRGNVDPSTVSYLGDLKLVPPQQTIPSPDAWLLALKARVPALRSQETVVWLAVSTHVGEDEQVLMAHAKLKQAFPDVLTVVAPRHWDKSRAVYERAQGMYARHEEEVGSKEVLEVAERPEEARIDDGQPRAGVDGQPGIHGQPHEPNTEPPHEPNTEPHQTHPRIEFESSFKQGTVDILVVDSLGHIDELCRNIGFVFVGGTFPDSVVRGGHNIMEPAQHGCEVAVGPFNWNIRHLMDDLARLGIQVHCVENGARLADAVAAHARLPFAERAENRQFSARAITDLQETRRRAMARGIVQDNVCVGQSAMQKSV